MTEGRTKHLIPVLFVLPCLGTGGSERVVMNLCLAMQGDFRPVVAAFKDGELAEKLRAAGVEVQILNRRDGIDLGLIFSVLKLIRRYRIQVINTHHFVTLFYTFWASRISGVPLIHTEHSRWEMAGLSRFWTFCFRFFLRHIEMVTAVSRGAVDYLQNDLLSNRQRTTLILNGIDIELFKKGAAQSLSRAELGLSEEDLVVGTIGNLRREKNQALLIRALALLREDNRKIKILLIGDGPCRPDLEALAAELGVADAVHFLGVRHDVARLYGVMDVYCLPSLYEGLPLTLLEAMAAGTPIVATDVLGIREVITHNVNGLLVSDNDPVSLKDALTLLGQQPSLRTQLMAGGLKQVAAEYGFAGFVAGYKALFTQQSRGSAQTDG